MTGRNAWLGLGGNIGDVRRTMHEALALLDAANGIEVRDVSGLYRTPPWGKLDQPPFLNACARVRTRFAAEALLAACLDVERKLGRIRDEPWGPRTIDIDILAMESTEIVRDGLTLPHPRLTERAFALAPLFDLAPDLQVNGRTVSAWLERVHVEGLELLHGPSKWEPGKLPWQTRNGAR